MKNRTLSSPILYVLALSLVVNPALLTKADPGVPASTSTSPAPAQPLAVTTASCAPQAPAPKHTLSYTVVAGDSLTGIAKKFNTTRKELKQLNHLTASTVKPGQILLVPSLKSKSSKPTTVAAAKAKAHHEYLMAQPVQDFDIPASTFASCPVPIPSPDEDADSSSSEETGKPAPIAKLVSPAELEAAEAGQRAEETASAPKPAPRVANNVPATVHPTEPVAKTVPALSSTGPTERSPSAYGRNSAQSSNLPSARLSGRSFTNPLIATPEDDWGNRFLQEARALGDQGIEYDEDWRPPGESRAWAMDCSNTARYLYKVTTGLQLPRTASDQYYYLHLQGKAWDVPQTTDGWADDNYLRRNLRPGDLLFWENTYRPERQPPITHVMIFLGTNDKGQWIMAGSQTSRGGEHNRRNGGPDIYVFRPSQPCGGYTTWLGLVHHKGRFCAFGRPLEADPSKLAVAEND
ncbi:MAG: LysM peptidoglycan-binding domain-containing protein [Methylacidiphilales bacterium]|nr:LysM peptidoglycan-binding domain-containing protein [Candidatus Methylacidiphilales bacterium]